LTPIPNVAQPSLAASVADWKPRYIQQGIDCRQVGDAPVIGGMPVRIVVSPAAATAELTIPDKILRGHDDFPRRTG
jgi:hypothetical protein